MFTKNHTRILIPLYIILYNLPKCYKILKNFITKRAETNQSVLALIYPFLCTRSRRRCCFFLHQITYPNALLNKYIPHCYLNKVQCLHYRKNR